MRTPLIDVLRPALRLGTRLYFGLRFEGVQHIPLAGPLIIAPNHVTFADPPLVSIPVRGRVASLNVSAAAAVLLFEAVRQRGRV